MAISNNQASTTELTGGPMPFYRVLEEEYERLHAANEDQQTPMAIHDVVWTFTEQQILDPRDLARRLLAVKENGDATGEDAAGLMLGNEDASKQPDEYKQQAKAAAKRVAEALEDFYRADRPLSGASVEEFKSALVARLNLLLDRKDLRVTRAIKALALSPYATTLRERAHQSPLSKIGERKLGASQSELEESDAPRMLNEANRLFIEAAFPTQLQRIRDIRLASAYDDIRRAKHSALSLSGGGIRSATFALGVVQGLASHNVLTKFNYISTVSGGGYIGGWLSAWMQHAGPEHVQEELRKAPVAKIEGEPVPIKHLRTFTNYLSPKLGLMSADTWTLAATYMRNVLLNWLVIIPLVAAVLLIPWGAIAVMNSVPSEWGVLGKTIAIQGNPTHWLTLIMYLLGMATGAYAVRYVHSDDAGARKRATHGPTQGKTQNAFLLRCLAPLVTSAILLTTAWYLSWKWDFVEQDRSPQHTLLIFGTFGVTLHFLGWIISNPFRRRDWLLAFFLIVFSGGIIGLLSSVIAQTLVVKTPNLYVSTAMPLFLLLLILSGQIYLGIASRRSNDSNREWGARFNAWIFIVVVAWAALSAIVVYGPELFSAGYRALVGAGIGGVSGLVTLLVGGSGKTNGKAENTSNPSASAATKSVSRKVAGVALGLAAPVFSIALIITISTLDLWFMKIACGSELLCRKTDLAHGIFQSPNDVRALSVLLIIFALLAVGWFFGFFIDTNDFSLHAMYRARLIRAYLGGSRPAGERRPDHFTGFDWRDDILMRDLWPAKHKRRRPLHVVNVTLNLVAGEKLAWQERKAESFTMTSLHSGSAFLGYRRTSSIANTTDTSDLYAKGTLSLGTAIAISGAAASPNMGYHSSPAVTFLMTLFNARLGGWFGNPGPAGEKSYNLRHPRAAVKPILSELFGLSDDRSDYVYLSDGGHFENIALYEMVLRRCRFVVVSDASCDEECSFNDLGNAIRKIRIDLGVPIEFDGPMQISSRGSTPTADSRAWAIGRIRYSCVDKPATASGEAKPENEEIDGVLLYIKPSFYGQKEPPDVYNYARSAPAFPHESTADQFFSESQFESYRALGLHIVNEMWSDPAVMKELIRAGFATATAS